MGLMAALGGLAACSDSSSGDGRDLAAEFRDQRANYRVAEAVIDQMFDMRADNMPTGGSATYEGLAPDRARPPPRPTAPP